MAPETPQSSLSGDRAGAGTVWSSWSTFPRRRRLLGFFRLAFCPGWLKAASTRAVATQVFRAATD